MVLGVIIGILLLTWGIAEYRYQLRVEKLTNALIRMGHDVLAPEGAIQTASSGVVGECRHVLDAVFAFDTGPCPRVGAGWEALVIKGGEADFISTLLRNGGFSVGIVDGRQGGGRRDGVGINIELTGLGDKREPYPPSTGKQWLQVGLTVLESK